MLWLRQVWRTIFKFPVAWPSWVPLHSLLSFIISFINFPAVWHYPGAALIPSWISVTVILPIFLFSLGQSGWSGCMVKSCREQWSLLFIQSHMCSCHSFFIVIGFQQGMLLHIDFLPSKMKWNVPNVPSSVQQNSIVVQELLKISYIIWIKNHHSVTMFPHFYKCKHCSLLWVSPTSWCCEDSLVHHIRSWK